MKNYINFHFTVLVVHNNIFHVQCLNCLAFLLSRTPKEPPQIVEPEVKPSTPSKEKRKSPTKTKEGNREVRALVNETNVRGSKQVYLGAHVEERMKFMYGKK